MLTVVGRLTMVSKLIPLPGVGETWLSEMTNRRLWWSDLTRNHRPTASHKLLHRPCPSSLAHL